MAVVVDFNRIDAERRRRGLTWGRVARLTGISPSAFTRWKTGHQEPDVRSLMKIADLFGLSVDQLLGRLPSSTEMPAGQVMDPREETVLLAYRASASVRKIVDAVVAEIAKLSKSADG